MHDIFLSGDSKYIENILGEDDLLELNQYIQTQKENRNYFEEMTLKSGIVPRLMRQEYEKIEGKGIPIYRHPCDKNLNSFPFNSHIIKIRDNITNRLGVDKQEFNHCLIQYYRNSRDNISLHSDKTLDIHEGSMIVNYSIGASRTMLFRKKKDKVNKR